MTPHTKNSRISNKKETAGARQAGKACTKSTILKVLRENKKISRFQVSKLTQLSTYQVEGLEREATQGIMSRVMIYIKALGYKADDLMHLMEKEELAVPFLQARGSLQIPLSEIAYKEGVKLVTYLEQKSYYFGQLQLLPSKNLGREKLPAGDMVMGLVREGTLVVDTLIQQLVFKKDNFFILPGNSPFEFVNGDGNAPMSALIFAVSYPQISQ